MTMENRGDGWIQTFSLRQFWPLDPRPEEVSIVDISHALSMMCRFTGHVHHFYSVAEHCVRVSLLAEHLAVEEYRRRGEDPWEAYTLEVARWGLLHDASEAYLVDLARPVKRMVEMRPYREAEARLTAAIAQRFGLQEIEPGEVKRADVVLCYTEARDLFPGVHPEWKWQAEPLPEKIVPLAPLNARDWFRARFEQLFPGEAWT